MDEWDKCADVHTIIICQSYYYTLFPLIRPTGESETGLTGEHKTGTDQRGMTHT